MTGSNSGEGRKGDWGGGGIFIQKNGRLTILKSLITDNKAGGWSGGIGAMSYGRDDRFTLQWCCYLWQY